MPLFIIAALPAAYEFRKTVGNKKILCSLLLVFIFFNGIFAASQSLIEIRYGRPHNILTGGDSDWIQYQRELKITGEWIKQNTETESILMATDPIETHVFSDRQSVIIPRTQRNYIIKDVLERYGINYIIVKKGYTDMTAIQELTDLSLVYDTPLVSVWEVNSWKF